MPEIKRRAFGGGFSVKVLREKSPYKTIQEKFPFPFRSLPILAVGSGRLVLAAVAPLKTVPVSREGQPLFVFASKRPPPRMAGRARSARLISFNKFKRV
jgi:hypothetical protein